MTIQRGGLPVFLRVCLPMRPSNSFVLHQMLSRHRSGTVELLCLVPLIAATCCSSWSGSSPGVKLQLAHSGLGLAGGEGHGGDVG